MEPFGEFARQARQVTSHPKSPWTTGSEAAQLAIIASFHTTLRRPLMLVVKNKSISLRWEIKSIFMSILWNNFLMCWSPTWPPCHVVANQEYSLEWQTWGLMCAHFTLLSTPSLSLHQGSALRVIKIRATRKGKQYNKALRLHLEIDLGITRRDWCARTDLSRSFLFLCNVMWFGWPRNT